MNQHLSQKGNNALFTVFPAELPALNIHCCGRRFALLACVSAEHGGIADTSQLPIDERPIVTREHGQGRAGASPDERYGDGSSYGGADGVQGSPPKAPPRILHSGEGPRPHESREGITAAISHLPVVATSTFLLHFEPKSSIDGLHGSTRIRLKSKDLLQCTTTTFVLAASAVRFAMLVFLSPILNETKYCITCDGNAARSASEGWDDGDGTSGKDGEYPPGEHPLEGVANVQDLAEPEALSAKVDLSEVSFSLGALGFRELATPSLATGNDLLGDPSFACLSTLLGAWWRYT